VPRVHGCSTFDEESYGRVLRAPGRYMQRRTVLRDAEIGVALLVRRRDVHAEIEEVANAVRIPDARELREQLAAFGEDLSHEPEFPIHDGADGRRVASRARGDQALDAMKLDGNASSLELLEHVSPSSPRGDRNRRLA